MSPRFPVYAFLSMVLSVSVTAQEVRDLNPLHRDGQTFLTWRQSSVSDTRYRVYRSRTRFRDESDLDRADFLGEVDDQSSRNRPRSLATRSDHGWVIDSSGSELGSSEGLFVHTVAESSVQSYYAVTSVRGGIEDRRLRSGRNTNRTSIRESAAPPQPVLQRADTTGELWAHWVGDRDTPYQPALSPWPSQGFGFRFDAGRLSGPRGLVIGLHAAGQQLGQGWPHRFELPGDVDLLSLSDDHPYTSHSFWFGTHEMFPDRATPDARVWNYTSRRILWTLDWVARRLGPSHDPERVYAVGGSLGAIGAMLLAGEAPERFAAILCRNGLYDPLASDYRNPALVQRLFGGFALGLRMRSGLPVVDRMHASFMANRNLGEDWPVIRTISGRNDETVGWMSAVDLFEGLAAAHRPAIHYFDERTHTPRGYWVSLERTLLRRMTTTRRDRPSLRFERLTLDDDPGNGLKTDGDPIGTINGYVEYDTATARAKPGGLFFDVYLRAEGFLDDAPEATGWARMTPRRMGDFAVASGDRLLFTLREGGVTVDQHVLKADEHGLVHTPFAPLSRTPREAQFERWSPGMERLFLGAAPIPGDRMQALLNGAPGAPWALTLSLGDAQGAFSRQPGVDHITIRGTFGADGYSDLRLRVPSFLEAGTWIWGRVFTGGQLSPAVGVELRSWP